MVPRTFGGIAVLFRPITDKTAKDTERWHKTIKDGKRPKKLLSVQGTLTQILLLVQSELINILLSVEGQYLCYSISGLMTVVLAWFDTGRVLIDHNLTS